MYLGCSKRNSMINSCCKFASASVLGLGELSWIGVRTTPTFSLNDEERLHLKRPKLPECTRNSPKSFFFNRFWPKKRASHCKLLEFPSKNALPTGRPNHTNLAMKTQKVGKFTPKTVWEFFSFAQSHKLRVTKQGRQGQKRVENVAGTSLERRCWNVAGTSLLERRCWNVPETSLKFWVGPPRFQTLQNPKNSAKTDFSWFSDCFGGILCFDGRNSSALHGFWGFSVDFSCFFYLFEISDKNNKK